MSSEDAAYSATVPAPAPASREEWHELYGLYQQLGDDERRVALFILDRLRRGQKAYGRLNLADDPRDWDREAAEEYADGAVYLACASLARSGR